MGSGMSPDVDLEAARTAGPARRAGFLVLAAVVAGVALVLLGRQAAPYVARVAVWIDGLGAWAPVLFILAYAIAVVAFVPGSILTLAGGALFGIVRGALYVFTAAVMGASGAFLVARYLARGVVERKLEGNPRFAAIDRAIAREGRKVVLLLRLTPLVPFTLLNYTLGLTRVRFVDFLVGSVGMLPGTLLYVYYGRVAGDVATLAAGMPVQRDAASYGLLGLGLAATIAVTAVVTRAARRALREVTGQ
jgi:uncharacterized membrane protein YdjX (TVP38/TMEM64 family)